MIPYGHQNIVQDDIEAVVKVLESDWITQGPVIEQFEQAVAGHCGVTHGIAMNSEHLRYTVLAWPLVLDRATISGQPQTPS